MFIGVIGNIGDNSLNARMLHADINVSLAKKFY